MTFSQWLKMHAMTHAMKPLAVAIGALGAAALYYEAHMGSDFWRSVALTDTGQIDLERSAIVLSCFAAAFSLAAGFLSKSDWKWTRRITLSAALILVAYNTLSVIGFQMRERMGSTIAADEARKDAADKARAARDEATDANERLVGELWAAYREAKKADDKSALLTQITLARKPAPTQKAPDAPVPPKDVQSLIVANRLGWDPQTVQMFLIAGFALLMSSGASLAFWIFGALWQSAPDAALVASVADAPAAEVANEPADPVPAIEGADEPEADPVPFPQLPRIESDGRQRKGSITQEERAEVEEFLAECLASAKRGDQAKAETVHDWFCQWQTAAGRHRMNLNRFGRCVVEIEKAWGRDIRFHDGRTVTYLGVAQPAFVLLDKAA